MASDTPPAAGHPDDATVVVTRTAGAAAATVLDSKAAATAPPTLNSSAGFTATHIAVAPTAAPGLPWLALLLGAATGLALFAATAWWLLRAH